jgi:type I restriction enzyme S subunit
MDYHASYLVSGPGIVVGRKGTVGAVTYIHDNFFPIDTTYFVQPLIDIKFYFLKFLLESLGLQKMNSDSAVPGLNRESALRSTLVSPNPEKIKKFELVVQPFFDKQKIISKENQHLTQLRDWLLPMLMNGQVTVA